jgi:hypothetical protein
MRHTLRLILAIPCALLALGQPARAALIIVRDQAFIDNRALDDPLLTGLNLNLEVVVQDPVGGSAALLSTGVASFSSSNPGYSLATNMFCCDTDPAQPLIGGFGATPAGVTAGQFANIAGFFTWTASDVNGNITGTSHNLDLLEVLAFPSSIGASSTTTTPTITWTDPNGAAPSGYTRGYVLKIYDATGQIYRSPGSLTASFAVPTGVMTAGQVYGLRAEIIDAKTSELNDPIHDPTQSRSVGWKQFMPIPLPGGLLLLGSALLSLRAVPSQRRALRRAARPGA